MCILEKTTIVPDGNPNEILELPILKMVVLRVNEQLVQIANDLALYPPIIDRHVLWFTDPVENELADLFGNFDEDFNNILAFSMSTSNMIADYITQGEIIDIVRVEHSYTLAGLEEFN
jgi:hypothetical protein